MGTQEISKRVQQWRDVALKEWRAFLERWPIEKLSTLTLEEYSNYGVTKDHFCYALEFGTRGVFRISGGNSLKFGVSRNIKTGQYVSKKGSNPEEVFKQIRSLIVETAYAARQRDFEKLKELSKTTNLEVLFWKVAYLYQDIEHPWLFPFGAKWFCRWIFDEDDLTVIEAQKRMMEEIKDRDYWEYSAEKNDLAYDHMRDAEEEGDDWSDVDSALEVLGCKRNAILAGAPGTGKTYLTKEIAVRLCSAEKEFPDRESINQEYQRLVDERRIRFTTFHPSMDYEDFIEGYKPVSQSDTEASDGQVRFEIIPGIFQQICFDAKANETVKEQGIRDNATVWKVSLKKTGPNDVREYCLKNDVIRIGWDDWGEDPESSLTENERLTPPLNAFLNTMQVGDIVVSCFSSKQTDAIGVVVGDYEWDDSLAEYKRLRRVKWLYKGTPIDVLELNNQVPLTLSTVYKMRVSVSEVLEFLSGNNVPVARTTENRDVPYVLIIDEINRGNVAKIFGELITLIEADKRDNGDGSGVSVVLPYSKKTFSVPSNLYILATMNTADRSIGSIDYAVRRRFGFVKIYPHVVDDEDFDADLFLDVSRLFVEDPNLSDEELSSSKFLNRDYDFADVWLGHSYFFREGQEDSWLRWKYDIRPILEEYIKDEVLFSAARDEIARIEKEHFFGDNDEDESSEE